MNVNRWSAGCWNAGCPAEPRLNGGAIAWVQLVEGISVKGQTWAYLLEQFPATGAYLPRQVQHSTYAADFCRLPHEFRHLNGLNHLPSMGRPVEAFLWHQWGLSVRQATDWGLGYCFYGRYAGRIVIPIKMKGEVVAFQARSYRREEPKYLNSRSGPEDDPKAECGRPARATMFNLDAASSGDDVMLVEGSGDVMHWHRDDIHRTPIAIGLLGMALTPEKLAMLCELNPRRVIVALDNEPETKMRATTHLQDLEGWGLSVAAGQWVGGKDAGAGAELKIKILDSVSQIDRVKAILGGNDGN